MRQLEEEYKAKLIVALVERWRVWFSLKDDTKVTEMLQVRAARHAAAPPCHARRV